MVRLVLDCLHQLRNVQTQVRVIQLRQLRDCKETDSLISKLGVQQRQGVFRLAILGLLRCFQEIVAFIHLVLVSEVDCSDVHGHILDKVTILSDEMPVVDIGRQVFLQRELIDDSPDFLNLFTFLLDLLYLAAGILHL